MTKSTDGREWAHLSELKTGDILISDGGFTCMPEGARRAVKLNLEGQLYIECTGSDEDQTSAPNEQHLLDGQLDDEDNDSLVGLWRVDQ